MILSGYSIVLDFFSAWAPQPILDAVSSFSFLTHFDSIKKGVIDARDVVYFASLIAFWLYANTLAINVKKAG
jgi:ABC-2 type transport system permease protein